jgi:nicotinamide mononucleotide transporter
MIFSWLTDNSIELFGAITGIVYVILEIRQITWLWPVGIITSAVYVWVFFTGKLYADMSLQVYYVLISALGWYWWARGGRERREESEEKRAESGEQGSEGGDSPFEGGRGDVKDHITKGLSVTHVRPKLAIKLAVILIFLYIGIYLALSKLTDSPVPGWDAFITSMSIIGTWMLARKIYEHWYLWIMVNSVSVILCLMRGLYPTVALYAVYLLMSFIGLYQWKKSIS